MVNYWRTVTGCEDGIDLLIEKKIPMQAGLGGGSSDAVSTLIGLNLLSHQKLSFDELLDLSARVGSDCPSFLLRGACVASGRGEQIREVKSDASKEISGKRVLMFKPSCGFSTADIYGRYQVEDSLFPQTNQMDERIEHWESGQLSLVDLMYNDLSSPVLKKFIFITVLFRELRERFKLKPMVSGSGSCCFFIIPEGFDIEPVKQLIRDSWGEDIFLTETKLL
jgi:4-diphosphocytidyl-2-C-methyl-D-erythritol kinase